MNIPDISFYQDDNNTVRGIDFNQMKSQTEAVIIRVGQNNWPDSDFKTNWQNAKNAGLLRGSYWFYDSRTSPEAQANMCARMFDGDFGELPFWFDAEENYRGKYRGMKMWIRFLDEFQRLVPYKEIGIYTGYYYWLENTRWVDGYRPRHNSYFSQFPLWLAQYASKITRVPRPWTYPTFWQYTDNGDGALYGVESKNIDLNLFTAGDWEHWKGLHVTHRRAKKVG